MNKKDEERFILYFVKKYVSLKKRDEAAYILYQLIHNQINEIKKELNKI